LLTCGPKARLTLNVLASYPVRVHAGAQLQSGSAYVVKKTDVPKTESDVRWVRFQRTFSVSIGLLMILWGATNFWDVPTVAHSQAEAAAVYTDKGLKFSFSYPGSWIKRNNKFEWRGSLNANLVLGIEFADPVREKEILIALCLNNRSMNWTRTTPTRATCNPVLTNLNADQEAKYDISMKPRNIFIRVYRTDMPLREWLLTTYRAPKTELESYEIGKDIELSGQKDFCLRPAAVMR